MAGIMLAFLPDYVGHRIILWRTSRTSVPVSPPVTDMEERGTKGSIGMASSSIATTEDDTVHARLKVIILEAGIIFHSLRKHSLISRVEPLCM